MAKKAKFGKYKGEIVLLPKEGKYPVTKKGKLNCNRVRSAKAYGTMHDDIPQLKKGGLAKYAKKCGFKI